jgi:hypothetical protein
MKNVSKLVSRAVTLTSQFHRLRWLQWCPLTAVSVPLLWRVRSRIDQRVLIAVPGAMFQQRNASEG